MDSRTQPRDREMNINQISEGKYLKKDDVEPPITVTITNVTHENLAREGEVPEMKYVLNFKEAKPLVMNMTNGQLIAHVLKSEETDNWIGKQITLYNDPSVSFGGKLTGGVRVLVTPTQPQQAAGFEDMHEDVTKDIPF